MPTTPPPTTPPPAGPPGSADVVLPKPKSYPPTPKPEPGLDEASTEPEPEAP
ncbi:hypothetical protein ACFC26_09745 [Kitasatospora purpeofusca]|uniref:hypothetical protein n=1 Tax=Kitasatospora purpeofusca TaxID=67352 RepID=UPI0035DED77E